MTDSETIKSDAASVTGQSGADVLTAFLTQLQSTAINERTIDRIADITTDVMGCSSVLVLRYETEDATYYYAGIYPPRSSEPDIYIPTFNADEGTLTAQLAAGSPIIYQQKPDDPRLQSLISVMVTDHGVLVPLVNHDDTPLALMALYNSDNTPLSEDTERIMMQTKALQPILSVAVQGALEREAKNAKIEQVERAAEILSKIDEELNDTIELNYVFTMMKDWALRFTNADSVVLALYDKENKAVRVTSHYGFVHGALSRGEELTPLKSGIALRVARTGNAEIVPDVSLDKDYYALAEGMRTQMTVPIKREEKVIGMIMLWSRKLNGFTDDNLDFVKRLASRAGVAVDNARLFTETEREREKLSNILRNIGDNVIVVGLDHRIQIINSSTILAFHLSAEKTYTGRSLTDVITHAGLQKAYQIAIEEDDTHTAELTLPNERTYHVTIEHHEGIGRIIIMQDITHFKELDNLKTELIATVSHDLKQPLSVMRGYLDLLAMVNAFDEKSLGYIDNLNFAFTSMRQLIDDLLDTAKIEAGLQLELETVSIEDILTFAVRSNTQQAQKKNIALRLDLPETLPAVMGDPNRLKQIFTNLVSNAVKYTQPDGHVDIYTELKQDTIRLFVKDDGMGIGPEDQTQIFERFYRVRRPETDSIEGTGLGLAIVKALVEAHGGDIDLKSTLGEGSIFRVTFPVQPS